MQFGVRADPSHHSQSTAHGRSPLCGEHCHNLGRNAPPAKAARPAAPSYPQQVLHAGCAQGLSSCEVLDQGLNCQKELGCVAVNSLSLIIRDRQPLVYHHCSGSDCSGSARLNCNMLSEPAGDLLAFWAPSFHLPSIYKLPAASTPSVPTNAWANAIHVH